MADLNQWSWSLCPHEPNWELAWPDILEAIPLLAPLRGCRQDALHHAEGDVFTHTRMVAEELVGLPGWRALTPQLKSVVLLAALLHDSGKPSCTVLESDGRVTSRGHAIKGAIAARAAIYREVTAQLRIPPSIREQIIALIRYHGLPLSFLRKSDPARAVIAASMTARCDLLAMIAEADVRGRICAQRDQLIETIGLFEELCKETSCWNAPFAFATDLARYTYLTDGRSGPDYVPFDTTRCRAVLMAGLPGAGKDSYIQANLQDLQVISLDQLRQRLGIGAADDQGPVVAEAKRQTLQLLRKGQDFVWNATNVTRSLRTPLISLFAAYHARVDIFYVETDYQELQRRNTGGRVPRQVIERLIDRLDPPDLTEAWSVSFLDG